MLPDSYVWRARIAPATLVLAPLMTLGVHLHDDLWLKTVPSAIVLVMVFLAGEVVRRAGRRLQSRLVDEWGGLPTTQMLRPTGVEDGRVTRRRDVAEAAGMELPSAGAYEADPAGADRVIREAVRAAVVTMRAQGSDQGILARENASYGFARNSAAVKPAGITVAAVVLALHVALLWAGAWHPPLGGAVLALGLPSVMLLVWILAIGAGQARQQAEFYAQHFFAALRSFQAGKQQAR